MTLNPLRTPLCVVQATICESGRAAQIASFSMPAAPFGTLPWQLVGLAAYVVKCQARGSDPSVDSFTHHMQARASSRIPAPATPYPYTAWHDERVRLLLDATLAPAGAMKWPTVSLAVMEQESTDGACDWVRLERARGAGRLLAWTAQEIGAEAQLLAGRMRTAADADVAGLLELAQQATQWARQCHTSARAAATMTRIAQVREALKVR